MERLSLKRISRGVPHFGSKWTKLRFSTFSTKVRDPYRLKICILRKNENGLLKAGPIFAKMFRENSRKYFRENRLC